VDLYGAVVTTTPFLLLALLVELRAFGPAASRSKRTERRRDRKTDLQVLLFLAVGFTAALIGLVTEVNHWAPAYWPAVRWASALSSSSS